MLPSFEWLLSQRKCIDQSGCWIPKQKANSGDGYARAMLNGERYILSRLSMCITNNIDYYNPIIDTRHSSICCKDCFNPDHLKPGSASDNMMDTINDGHNHQLNKDKCPKCNNTYTNRIIKSGPNKGRVSRYCRVCFDKSPSKRSRK